MRKIRTLIVACMVICTSTLLKTQTTVTIPSTQDATIFSEQADGANGKGFLFVGTNSQGNLRRTLIQFDVSSIPQDANILSATLQVTGSKSSTENINLHRLTSPWSEGSSGIGETGGRPLDATMGDATWSHGTYNTEAWAQPGGDYIEVESGYGAALENTVNTWRGEEMIWDIYGWLLGNVPNYGWIMIGDESGDRSAVRLVSGESTSNFPVLIVTYGLPEPDCDADGGALSGGPFTFCVGDDIADQIAANDVTLSNQAGSNSQWIVTDLDRNILGLPGSFTDVDFDGTGTGTCLIWHLSYEDGLTGAVVGNSANDLAGCFDLSNPIAVNRIDDVNICVGEQCLLEGALLTGGPFRFCVNDGLADQLGTDDIGLFTNSDANSSWVITDINRNILGIPGAFSDVNFEGAGVGICQIWHILYEEGLTGLSDGQNLDNLEGCFALSNPVLVERKDDNATCNPCGLTSALLTGGPFDFCVGDGLADIVPAGGIGLFNNTTQGLYVITDINRDIFGIHNSFTDVDFDGTGTGTALIYYVQSETTIAELVVGGNIDNLTGCLSLSNPVTINRTDDMRVCSSIGTDCQVQGGILSGGPYTFCVGDGTPDRLASDAVGLFNNSGGSQRWIVTDINANILGLPGNFTDVDFDGAGEGVCQLYSLQFDGDVSGIEVGQNLNQIQGCSDLSNPVTIFRTTDDATCNPTPPEEPCTAVGGVLTGGPFTFCVGDGEADQISSDEVVLSANAGVNTRWVVTDSDRNILGLPGDFSQVNFDGAGPGTCLLYSVSYDNDVTGFAVDLNLDDLIGCHSISNAVAVVRIDDNEVCGGDPDPEPCQVNAGALVGGPYTYCVGDGEADVIPSEDIELTGVAAPFGLWVVTDLNKTILGTSSLLGDIDFDSYETGLYLLWFVGGDTAESLSALAVGGSIGDVSGCTDSSNPVQIDLNDFCNIMVEGCQTPTNLWANKVSSASYKIKWDRGPSSIYGYEVHIGFKDEPGSFVIIPAARNSITITASWSKTVLVRVRMMCSSSESSEFTEFLELGTKDESLGRQAFRTSPNSTIYGQFSVINDEILISPNPAFNFVDISFLDESATNVIDIISMQGQRVIRSISTQVENQRLDINELSAGMYIMTVTSNGKLTSQTKFIVAK